MADTRMDITVRFATAADAQQIFAWIMALAEHQGEPGRIVCTVADFEAQLQMSPAPFECLVAEGAEGADGAERARGAEALLGVALFYTSFSAWRGVPSLVLEDLFVAGAYRRSRVATRLLVELSRLTVHRGCHSLQWRAPSSDQVATDFCASVGAIAQDVWIPYELSGEALTALACRPAPGSPEEAASSQMGLPAAIAEAAKRRLVADHNLLGSEFTWVCSDSAGHVAAFCISKQGPVPSRCLDDRDSMDRTYEALDGLAPCGHAVVVADPTVDVYYSTRLADRGVFAYDWHPDLDAYVLVARPSDPRKVADLRTAADREGASLLVLTVPFEDCMAYSRTELEAALSISTQNTTQS